MPSKTKFKFWILSAALVGEAFAAFGEARMGGASGSGTIVVVVDGFRNVAGSARVAVFRHEQGFPDSDALRKAATGIKDGRVEVRFEGLPFGDYAVSMYHDENDDGKLNRKLFGIPKEGYAVSNNVVHARRSARFDEAKLALREEVKEIHLRVHY